MKRIAAVLSAIAVILAISAWYVLRLPVFGGAPNAERLARSVQSKQFHGSRFENTPAYVSDFSIVRELKAYSGDEVREPTFKIPVVPMSADALSAAVTPGLRAWWLGHASVLIEIDGVRLLTDPMFSRRASPFQFIGPERLHETPLALELWRNIDAVVISHDHFDHLDMATIRHLAKGGTHFYVGLGIGAHLATWDVKPAQIHEMDWWESAEIKGVKIHCTPARHYSGRTSMNNSTLWASWMLKGPNHSVYFSGDTGYADHFKTIRERLGAPDLSLMKIGAYGDTWLDIHMNPEAAIQANQDLGAGTMLPIHWASFNLAYHDWAEPILRAMAAAKAMDVRVVTPRVGEMVDLAQPIVNQPWYRSDSK